MSVTNSIQQLPQWMSFTEAEAIAAKLKELDVLTIDLHRFRRARLCGEGALLGLVRLAKLLDKAVDIQLAGELPSFVTGGNNRYWKVFTESVAGFVLAQSAQAIYDSNGRDVTAEIQSRQSQILKAQDGLIGSGKEVAAAISDRFGAPRTAPLVREGNATHLRHLLAYSLAARLGIRGEPGGAFTEIATFVSELLENTRDHAMADLDGVPIEGVRFLNIRRINPNQEDLRELSPLEADVGGFSVAVSALLAASISAEHLVEITVADSGPGIAARMCNTATIYEAPIVEERRAISRALTRGGSSKPASVTGRGLGLEKVLEATRRLGGLFVLRTGRTRLYSWAEGRIDGLDDPELHYLPGTSVSILFPWKVRSGQMDLFGHRDANCSR